MDSNYNPPPQFNLVSWIFQSSLDLWIIMNYCSLAVLHHKVDPAQSWRNIPELHLPDFLSEWLHLVPVCMWTIGCCGICGEEGDCQSNWDSSSFTPALCSAGDWMLLKENCSGPICASTHRIITCAGCHSDSREQSSNYGITLNDIENRNKLYKWLQVFLTWFVPDRHLLREQSSHPTSSHTFLCFKTLNKFFSSSRSQIETAIITCNHVCL